MEHENDPDIDEPYVPPAGNVLGGEAGSQSSAVQPTAGDTVEGWWMFFLVDLPCLPRHRSVFVNRLENV